MKNFKPFLFILFFVSTPVFAMDNDDFQAGQKYLTLYMGIQHQEILSHLPPDVEPLGDFRNFVTIDVDKERKILRFTPKKPGVGTLTLHDRSGKKFFEYRMEVRQSDLTRVVREVRGLLYDIEGISIKIVNNKVIIDGKVLSALDLNRIYGVIKQYDNRVASLVEISPLAQKKIALMIERDINNPDIEVRAVNGKFILKGIANSDSEKKTAEIIAKTYVPPPVMNEAEASGKIKKRKEEVVINMLSVRASPPPAPKKIIQLVAHYVELSKKYLRSSAFGWAPVLSDQTDVSFTKDTTSNSDGFVAEITGVITNLLPKLNRAKRYGFARILKSSSVTTTQGQKGVITSQTNIPYIATRQPDSFGGNSTGFAPVGVTAAITPDIVNPRSDMLSLQMSIEVKALVGRTDLGPQISTNKVETVVNVRSGQSAAIGGLIDNTSGSEYNPDANSDALFNLYAAKNVERNKSQFVVFITPLIKSSASAGSENVKRKFRLRE